MSEIFLETATSRTIRMTISSAKRIVSVAVTGLVISHPLGSSGRSIDCITSLDITSQINTGLCKSLVEVAK